MACDICGGAGMSPSDTGTTVPCAHCECVAGTHTEGLLHFLSPLS